MVFEQVVDGFGGDDGAFVHSGAEGTGEFPVVFCFHDFGPEGIGPALFGFGGVDVASVGGQKKAG